ncbi:unnamed protein product [Cylindrotheca closterium]|uniref:Cyclin-dependent kinase 2 homolog n=1 Tax=Cylindrotheca closterium TaxID=2856 RepID=A0AAD2PWV1_9STRA|nr:unnamed protein product [Cylindrotheca closterium]
MSKKRDRWDSSSSSEEEKEEATPKPLAASKNNSATKATTTTTSSNKFPLHNPLLQGCRSVYDTYDRIDKVSEGSYGIVWKARDLATQEIVALKQIKFEQPELMEQQGFPLTALREISTLLQLQHESIVGVKEMVVGSGDDKVFMVMEFMEKDLQQAIKDTRQYPNVLRQAELKGIMKQILEGVAYMHEHWMLHRDLKTSNILVHSTGRVALCDLGLARRYEVPAQPLTLLVVTLWYRAPELLMGETKYGPPIDVWSLGCIFGELILAGEALMQGQGELDQLDKLFQMVGLPTEESWPDYDQLPHASMFRWKKQTSKDNDNRSAPLLAKKFPINAPPHFKQSFLDGNGYDLLSKLLALDPKQRITAKEALAHPYFHTGVPSELPVLF